MHFNFYKQELLVLLNKVSGAIEKRQTTLPVLSNFLIEAKDNNLYITGTDLELELVAVGSVEQILTEGSTTVPAKVLLDVLRAIPEKDKVEFFLEEDRVIILNKSSKFSLRTIQSSEFPRLESEKIEQETKINKEELKKLISTTSFAMAQQDVRYFLNGMLLEFFTDKVRVVCTDGHRLATNTSFFDTGIDGQIKVILPKKTIQELQKVISSHDDISIYVSEKTFIVKSLDFRLISRAVEGKFPNYERVIPKTQGYSIKVDAEELKQALLCCSSIINDKTKAANITFHENNMKIYAVNSDNDEVEENIKIDYQGEKITVGFNIGYLVEYLQILKEKHIIINVIGPSSSAVLKTAEQSDHLYVVMPMRL